MVRLGSRAPVGPVAAEDLTWDAAAAQSAIDDCDGPHVLGRTGRVTLGSGVPVEVGLNWQATTQPKIARAITKPDHYGWRRLPKCALARGPRLTERHNAIG
jgi:hypothetical protein